MPKASAPKAPWVAVCESPQQMVMPGWVSPRSGPMMWTTPFSLAAGEKKRMPKSCTLFSRLCSISSAMASW